MTTRHGWLAASIACALTVAACTGSDEGISEPRPPAFDAVQLDGAADEGPSFQVDSTDARTREVDAGADAAPDTSDDTAPPLDCTGDARPATCRCDDAEQCASGYCMATDAGQICVEPCVDSCSSGFACVPVPFSPDVVYLCLPRFAKLCQPCRQHTDCQARGDAGLALCLDYGDEGRFCGAVCGTEADCPVGYGCEERTLGDGTATRQCVKADGQCHCSAVGIALEMGTTCGRSNDFGTCAGERVCGTEGLSVCSAAEPAREVCDNIDNDCDGMADNLAVETPCFLDNPFGVCQGTQACANGASVCLGEAPAPEVCDGVDNDCDGQTDEETCDDGNECTADACDPLAGACVHRPVDEACDDGDACTLDRCERVDGCHRLPVAGAACDDGSACTTDDRCGDDGCRGVPVAGCCDVDADCDDSNACTRDRCDAVLGTCAHDTAPLEGSACDADGDGCTADDRCQAGSCVAGAPVDCGPSPFPCQAPRCVSASPEEHRCELSPRLAGTACSDDDVCTVQDQCDGAGACVPGDAVDGCCHADGDCDDDNPCTVDVCDQGSGTCRHLAAADETPCNADDSGCTAGDRCLEGACVPGPPVQCDAPPCSMAMCVSEGDDGHRCEVEPSPAGVACDDGDGCTAGDACDGAGACLPGGRAPGCCRADGDCDDGNPCTADACLRETGECTNAPLPDGNGCSDGDGCTVGDACQGGACVPGPAADCSGDDGTCRRGVCSAIGEDAFECVVEQAAAGDACDDGTFCTVDDVCDAEGACLGRPRDCTPEDPGACSDGFCDEIDQACVLTPRTDGAWCSDGDPCTLGDACVAGTCRAGVDQCVEEVLDDRAGSWNAPSVVSMGRGRYAVLMVRTAWIQDAQRLRFVSADGGLEERAVTLPIFVNNTPWASRPAINHFGEVLVAVRETNDRLRAHLFDNNGVAIRSVDLPIGIRHVRDSRYPPGGSDRGRIVVVPFADGGFGIVTVWGARSSGLTATLDTVDRQLDATPQVRIHTPTEWDRWDAAALQDGSDRIWITRNGDSLGFSNRLMLISRAGEELGVNSQATVQSFAPPALAAFPDGDVAVVHLTSGNTASIPLRINVQRLSPDGTLGDAVSRAANRGSIEFGHLSAATLSDGRVAVAWTEEGADRHDVGVQLGVADLEGGFSFVALANGREDGGQRRPGVAALADDDLAVAWLDAAEGVVHRRFTAEGDLSPGRLERDAPARVLGDQGLAAAAAIGGDVLLAYESPLFAGGDPDILLRRFDALGEGGAERPAHPTDVRDQSNPRLTRAADGYIASWTSIAADNPPSLEARRVGADGAPVGAVLAVGEMGMNLDDRHALAALPSGDALFSWLRVSAEGSNQLRFASLRVGADQVVALPLPAPFDINRDVVSVALAAHPSEALYALGFVRNDAGLTASVATLDASGAVVDGPVAVTLSGYAGVDVAISREGVLAACFVGGDTHGRGIQCATYEIDGLTPRGAVFDVNRNGNGDQSEPRCEWTPDGGLAVAWTSTNVDLDGEAVLLRAFDTQGFARGPARMANRQQVGRQLLSFLLPVSTNRVWVGWRAPDDGAGTGARFRILERP